jgi:hypothetical protein
MHSEQFKNYTVRQKIAVVAAMIHGILFSLSPSYGNCRDKIQALLKIQFAFIGCNGPLTL